MSIHILELIQLVQDRQGEMLDMIKESQAREKLMLATLDVVIDQVRTLKLRLNDHIEEE